MMNSRYKGPIFGFTLFSLLAITYIAYYYYNKSRKRRFLKKLKRTYNHDHELYDEEDYSYSDDDDFYADDNLNSIKAGSPNRFHDFVIVDHEDAIPGFKSDGGLKSVSNQENRRSSRRRRAVQVEGHNNHKGNIFVKLANMGNKFFNDGSNCHVDSGPFKSDENLDRADHIEDIKMERVDRIYEIDPHISISRKSKSSIIRPVLSKNTKAGVNTPNKCKTDGYRYGSDPHDAWVVLDGFSSDVIDESTHNDETPSNGINSSAVVEGMNEECFLNSVIPGKQAVYFRGFGCSHNISDSEYMKGLLIDYGYRITSNLAEANVALINSCTVKGPSQDSMTNEIRKARLAGIPVVVGGCVSQADKDLGVFNDPGVSLIGISQIERIVEVVEQTLQRRKVILLDRVGLPSLNLPKIRKNPLIEIIPISTGCLGACRFCKTKHARGVLGSYSIEAILDRVESVISEGVKQIWLTSEDTGAYGIDLNTDIVNLLKAVLVLLPQDVMLRLGMSNPPYIKRHIHEIANILKHENVFEFLHIPVQSGSDRVLDAMNRDYKVEDFLFLVERIRESVPNCTLATDIICGFPTETADEHAETVALLKKLKLQIVNISQFYPRPGTAAAKMKPQENKVGKSRTREVTELFLSYECNNRYVGKTMPVWFSEIDETRGKIIGHTKNYIKVIVDKDPSLVGGKANVIMQGSSKWNLVGVIKND